MRRLAACAECDAPLDGDSRFWCRKHYRVLGTVTFKVTDETRAAVDIGLARIRFREMLRAGLEKEKGDAP